jgi:hypothetical protein
MLALFVSAAAGYYFYTVGGAFAGIATAAAGYVLFALFAYVRAGMLVRDPVQRLAIAATGRPRGKEVERFASAIMLPVVGAFLCSLVVL